ncbi:hypothetical protein BVC80_351g1 [Macleaya cordata]|uniref:Retrotransposon Copia-like N-terminal domain-containing protein n=1 Tax=Macleaya cordata TaxID=56857 RepID=A0A200QKG6_MACCD|nr:hypothetical protein BVC80_351g1 [Macleaya cordata]
MASHSPLNVSNISNLVPIKLTRENYILWKSVFLPILRSYNLLRFVDGSHPCPSRLVTDAAGKDTQATNPDFTEWRQLLTAEAPPTAFSASTGPRTFTRAPSNQQSTARFSKDKHKARVFYRGSSSNSGSGSGSGSGSSPRTSDRPVCQICNRVGHTAIDCHNRMNHAFQGRIPTQRLRAMVATNAIHARPSLGTEGLVTLPLPRSSCYELVTK